MKKISLILKFFIISNFFIGITFYSSINSFAQPHIIFNDIYYDFGEIKTNELVTHMFEFKNAGNKILSITKVDADCGCITHKPRSKGLNI